MFIVNPYIYAPGYLLDTYSAAAAYSLRQLKTGVTSVVRVRRSSDNAESDFTADEITDGTLTTWTGANDGFVVTWYDQSGGGNNVTQATAGNQPQIVSSGSLIVLSSGYGLDFTSTSKRLVLGAGLSALDDGAMSVFSATINNDSDIGVICTASQNTSNRSDILLTTTGLRYGYNMRRAGVNSLGTFASTPVAGTSYLVTAISDASRNFTPYLNGTAGTGTTPSAGITSTSFTIGYSADTGAEYTGVISELIIFNTDESANRTDIESDINTYYSIY